MQQLWPKLLQTLPEQINETLMMLGRWIYFYKNKNCSKVWAIRKYQPINQ